MNICEALKISKFVTTADHNGIIRAHSGDEWESGFSRLYFSETGEFNTYTYEITANDLERDDWEPIRLTVTSEKIETRPPSPLSQEEVEETLKTPEGSTI